MKIIAKPIEVVCWFSSDGIPHPVRFRIKDEEENNVTIKIDRVSFIDKEKIAGNSMLKFCCHAAINGSQNVFELKYELSTCKWMLYKI